MPLLPFVCAVDTRTSSSSTSNEYGYTPLFKIFLLVLVAATGIRLAIFKLIKKKRMPTPGSPAHVQEKGVKLCQVPSEEDLRQRRILERKDEQPPAFKPIYPWTSPPQALPGPYDPRLYPLPTIRRHSYDPPVVVLEQNETMSYTRRVSTNSIPNMQTTLHGTVTTSTKGWRRNQWAISGA